MLSIGIVGLPNVGKSTLFNVLLKKRQALVANYPFATIDSNVGIVEIPDERLQQLAGVSKSKKITPTAIKFVDIAGLVSGASQGEGLGNKFLSHIRECDAIVLVIRFFEDSNVVHVAGAINPKDDFETLKTELILSDMTTLQKLVQNNETALKKGEKDAIKLEKVLSDIYSVLSKGKLASIDKFETEEEQKIATSLPLITLKPMLIAANLDEKDLNKPYNEIANSNDFENITIVPFCAKLEEELLDLDEKEAREYLKNLKLKDTGLDRLIKSSYSMLNLMTYFTSGEQETRAWTIPVGTKAPQAAGKIHKDFERGFIAADIVPFDKFIKHKGWVDAKKAGTVKTEGKEYIMQDGDVCFFKFNV